MYIGAQRRHRVRTTLLVLLLAIPLIFISDTSQANTYSPPAGIDRTGQRDVTAELLAFFGSVPDGSTISFPSTARYRIDGSLLLVGRNNLLFEGNGATFFAVTPGDRNRRHFWFQGGSNIVMRNVVVKGANPAAGVGDAAYQVDKEAQHAFDFGAVRGVELDRVVATDLYGDFVYLGARTIGNPRALVWTSDVYIHDSTFARSGRQGIAITGAERVRITRVDISEVRRSVFDIEPTLATWGAKKVTIEDNSIGTARLNFIASKGNGSNVEDIIVRRNHLYGTAMQVYMDPPDGHRRRRIEVSNNRSDVSYGNPGGGVMVFKNIDGVSVFGNYQRLQAGRDMTGVRAEDSCLVVVHGNQFPNATSESRITAPLNGCDANGAITEPPSTDSTGGTSPSPATTTTGVSAQTTTTTGVSAQTTTTTRAPAATTTTSPAAATTTSSSPPAPTGPTTTSRSTFGAS